MAILLAICQSVFAEKDQISANDFLNLLEKRGSTNLLRINNAVVYERVSARSIGTDTLSGRIELENVQFVEAVSFDNVVFTHPLKLTNVHFEGGVSFLGTVFQKDVIFEGVVTEQHSSFKRAHFVEKAIFTGSRFEGLCAFSKAHFNQSAYFTAVQFQESAYFEKTHFQELADFRDALFAKEITFKGAVWEGEGVFSGARFNHDAHFQFARFNAHVTFDGARFRRKASFAKSTFGASTIFRNVNFVGPTSFLKAEYYGESSFDGASFMQGADFTSVSFRAPTRLRASFHHDLILRHVRSPVLDLRASFSDNDDGFSLSDSSRLYLQESHFDRLIAEWSQLRGHIVADDSVDVAALKDVYGKLRYHLRHSDAVIAVHIEWMDLTRTMSSWSDSQRFILECFNLTSRYGTSLWRLVVSGVLIVLIFTLAFWMGLMRTGCSVEGLGSNFRFSLFTFTNWFRFSGRTPEAIGGWPATEALLGWIWWTQIVIVSIYRLTLS